MRGRIDPHPVAMAGDSPVTQDLPAHVVLDDRARVGVGAVLGGRVLVVDEDVAAIDNH
jgi:hypothetical protein